jgi:hypothetical protein
MKPLTTSGVTLGLFFCLLASTAVGQTKSDIWGFYPGMNETDFSAVLQTNELSCSSITVTSTPLVRAKASRKERRQRNSTRREGTSSDAFDAATRKPYGLSCYLQSEQTEDVYLSADRLEKKKDKITRFTFYRTEYLSLIWTITYDFFSGKSGDNLVSEISSTYSSQPTFTQRWDYEKRPGCRQDLMPRAIWKIGTRTLALEHQRQQIVRDNIPIDSWRLWLCDEQVLDKDQQAFEQKKRDVNPPTKF